LGIPEDFGVREFWSIGERAKGMLLFHCITPLLQTWHYKKKGENISIRVNLE